ncbi:YhjD/YihY/BrkB family envelope integrity protein [Argonema antarcticum]|uniref:YhjD/YihY/BrkB family envelope integrity protein n=1 Tax=Argonema antarcticum TaxID=2942763 RepID=UPI0020118B49|nr:YhjD/YihY/BrkB family envelope integrity protein [Argonema antarcticum]MCL1470092.1 YihY/virulence factor BrkB family protein [Argonema antarcticum A004/B2]
MSIRTIWVLLKTTFSQWRQDRASLMAAALAYYTVFSLAPLLVIALALAGAIFGEKAAKGELVTQIQSLIGKDAAELIQAAIENASYLDPSQGIIPPFLISAF